METTYTILGADGQQYGPINFNQLQIWLREGRITPETQILRSDINAWHPASHYSELGMQGASGGVSVAAAPLPVSAPIPALQSAPLDSRDPALEKQAHSGADWFFWIAGLSLINTVVALFKGGMAFALGLGITQIIDVATAKSDGGIGMAVGILFNVIVLGIFIGFGFFARRGHTWSFIVGMVLYGLDLLLLVLLHGGWLSIGFHGFALFCIFNGLKANMQANALQKGAR